MNAIIQGLNANIGILTFVLTIGVGYIAARSLARSKVGDAANKAQSDAIKAMEEEIKSIRRKMDDLEKDNKRLKRVIETIRVALSRRGITITISDDAIDIEDSKKSTTVRIRDEDEK
jgi:septal ring factor EnvC (AmiA/AmiB activator)